MLRWRHGLTTASKLQPGCVSQTISRADIRVREYSSEQLPSQNVAVLGGGVTGLATAYYLSRELPKAKITIYEASDRLGGWLSSQRVPVKDGSVLFEAGPRSLRPASNGVLAARLLQELDLAKDAIFAQRTSPGARNRYLYYPDHLVRMPNPSYGLIENFRLLFSESVFNGTIWGGFTEFWKDSRGSNVQDESVGDFFSRRFSKPTVDRILSAIIHGIYAGDVWKLSAKSLFPGPWRDEVAAGSVFAGMMKSRAEGLEVTKREAEYLQDMKSFQWEPLLRGTLQGTSVFTFKEGLGQLSDAFARYLMGAGNVEFRTSTPVESVALSKDQSKIEITSSDSQETSSYSNVICTLSPAQLNKLHTQSAAALMPWMPATTVMTVNLYYRTPDLNPPGFGYLIPQGTSFENNPERALGVVFDTAYSPSPKDIDTRNWQPFTADVLKDARESGQLVNVNDFAWYNMPSTPNMQDDVAERGTKLTVMLGGHWWDGWPAYPDEQEGLALAKSLLERHLGIKEEPEVWQINLQKDCIPQYTVGHEERLKKAHGNLAREYESRLRVAGSWMSGVGVNDCLRSAWEVARSLKAGKSGTGLEHVGASEYVRLKPIRPGQKEEEESL